MNKFFAFIVLGIVLLAACDNSRIAEEWVDLPDTGWHKDSLCTFTTELTDTLNFVDLYLGIRNENIYSYSNLWLFVSIISPTQQVHVDTFQVDLATPHGKWYGKGWGNLYTLTVPYRKNVRFVEQGDFTFQVQQGMRADVLEGISSVGFRIQKRD